MFGVSSFLCILFPSSSTKQKKFQTVDRLLDTLLEARHTTWGSTHYSIFDMHRPDSFISYLIYSSLVFDIKRHFIAASARTNLFFFTSQCTSLKQTVALGVSCTISSMITLTISSMITLSPDWSHLLVIGFERQLFFIAASTRTTTVIYHTVHSTVVGTSVHLYCDARSTLDEQTVRSAVKIQRIQWT